MKQVLSAAVLALFLTVAGCGGKGDTGLMGRLPQGYDAYITFDPERADLSEILETVEKNLPDNSLADIEDAGIPFNVFDWGEWKDELGLEPGEIGIAGLSDEMEFLALFLPAGNGEKLAGFFENEGIGGEVEFLRMEEYTVVIVNWNNENQIDDLEDALGESPLKDSEVFMAMAEKVSSDNPAISFVFFQEITEFPMMCVVSRGEDDTEISYSVMLEDNALSGYSDFFGNGLQSGSIMFPENTMAALRFSIDTAGLALNYEDAAETEDAGVKDIEAGLAFIGFSSIKEFIEVFRGDFCVAVSEIEVDRNGEPRGGAGLLALSLADPEKLATSLNMISVLAESERESFSDYTAYHLETGDEEIWYFISNDVLYVSFNTDPGDITGGMNASGFFRGSSADGFMGGAANPEMVVGGLSLDRDTEELILGVFAETADFSVSFDGTLAYSTATVGPDALTAIVSLAMKSLD